MGASIAAGPHSTSIPSLIRSPWLRAFRCANRCRLRDWSAFAGEGRWSCRVGRCRSGREAPGLLPIRAFAQGRAAICRSFFRPGGCEHLPAASPWSVRRSFLRTGRESRSGRCLPSLVRSRTGLRDARTDSREGRCGMLPVPLRFRFRAGWRPKSLPRLALPKRCRRHPVCRSRRPQFRASADQPEGTCRLVTLQSFRVRIVVRFIPVNQRLGR